MAQPSAFRAGLKVAALGVVQEEDKIRVIHKESNTVEENHWIKLQDQLRCPGARELKEVGRGCGAKRSMLAGDISKAPRDVNMRESDWEYHGCWRVPRKVWVNRVGNPGVTNASNWWSRFAATMFLRLLLQRLG